MPDWKPRSGRLRPRFLKGHNFRATGRTPANFNGGVSYNRALNRWVISCRDGTQTYYYRAVMAAHLGRDLHPGEVVHHINGDSTDDRIENLRLHTSEAEHQRSEHPDLNIEPLLASGMQRAIGRERLLDVMREWIDAHGRDPRYLEFEADPALPSGRTYWRTFGSWPKAVELAKEDG